MRYARWHNDFSPRREMSPIEAAFLGLSRENQYAAYLRETDKRGGEFFLLVAALDLSSWR